MTDEQIAFSIAKMKEYGIVDSGDTLKLGIGAMTDERWSDFYNTMVKAGMVKPGIDYKRPTRCSSSTRASASTCVRSDRWPPPPLFLRRGQRVVDVGRQHGGNVDRRRALSGRNSSTLLLTGGRLLRKAAIASASASVRCEKARMA